MRLMKEKKRNGSFTFDSGVVPVRRPLSCVKSVWRFCTAAYGLRRESKPIFFNGFFFTLRRAWRLLFIIENDIIKFKFKFIHTLVDEEHFEFRML